MATDQHVRAGGIPVLDRYFEALRRQDWESLAACLAEDVHRTGPYRDEVRGREAYVAFLSKVIPSLRDYDLVVSQAHAIGSDAARRTRLTAAAPDRGATACAPGSRR